MNNSDNRKFATVTLDIYCVWLNEAPNYRLYVNEELFADRTFRWDKNKYLQENIEIHGIPGLYTITIEHDEKHVVDFNACNLQIKRGKARRISDREFEIR